LAIGLCFGPEPAKAALVSYWPFEGNFNDVVGPNTATKITFTGTSFPALVNSNDATTAVVAGRSGQSLVLDGNADGLQTPANSSLDFGDGTSFTISLWYKATQNTLDNNTTTAVGDGRSTLIMRDTGTGQFNGYSIVADTINTGETGGGATSQFFRTALDGGANADSLLVQDTTDVINYFDNAWHHLAVVVSNVGSVTGTATFYFDGAPLVATTTNLSALLANGDGGLSSGAVSMFIGAERTTGSRWFKGSMDDLAVWGDALPESSITGLANGTYTPLTAPIPEPGSMILAGMSLAGVIAGYRLRKRS
jgi:hypothetical protein